jgi:hypothetical protein
MGVVVAFVFGWLVMLLWNWIMPAVFGLSTITFWQAWGLVILAHLLFKNGPGHHDHDGPPFHHHPNAWRDKFKCKIEEHFNKCGRGHKKPDAPPEPESSP